MAKPGTTTCYYKPRRSVTRRFSAKDVARVYCHAVNQGVARSDIGREIERRCPTIGGECTCDEMLAELIRAEKMAALMIEVITAAVVIGRILKVALKVIQAARQKQLEREMKEAIKQLDTWDRRTKPIIQGEFERLIEKQAQVAARMEGGVVIKP